MEVKSIATDAGRAKFVQLLRYSLVLHAFAKTCSKDTLLLLRASEHAPYPFCALHIAVKWSDSRIDVQVTT